MAVYKRRTQVRSNVRCSLCGDKIPVAVTTAAGTAVCSACRNPRTPTCGKPEVRDVGAGEPLDDLLKQIEDAE